MLLTGGIEPLEGEVRDDREEDLPKDLDCFVTPHRDREAETEEEVSVNDARPGLIEGLGHSKTVNGADDKGSLPFKGEDAFRGQLLDCFSFQRVLQAAAVDDGGGFGPGNQGFDFPEGVFAVLDLEVNVGSADAKAVDFSVQLGEEFTEAFHVAVSSSAFEAEGFAKQLDFSDFVAFTGAEANRNDSFQD